MNLTLIRWVKRKYKRIRKSTRRAYKFIANIAKARPLYFTTARLG
ncbi:hypothetical protein [Clostridium sp.]